MDWRLLVEGCIANIGIPLEVFVFLSFDIVFGFRFLFGFLVFANRPTVQNGEIAGGGSVAVAVAVGVSER